ncbi:hypothetical protein DFJ74DRAFT_748377 [Hyaloraphidium curvatum]|nr:hypothetical protein DFJ74DRAFT_748377 [Hyaloraphidium curvatum]
MTARRSHGRPSRASDARASAGGDFEFAAPRYHDFDDGGDDDGADEWFDTRAASPPEGAPRAAMDIDDDGGDDGGDGDGWGDGGNGEGGGDGADSGRRSSARSLRSRPSHPRPLPAQRSMPARRAPTGVAPAPAAPALAAKEPYQAKKLTVPKEFRFQSEARAAKAPAAKRVSRPHPGAKGGGVQKKVQPGKEGRKQAQQKTTLTVPKPFQFQTAFKALAKEAEVPVKSPFVPLAVKVKQFEQSSPVAKRTRTKQLMKAASPKLTNPRSPRLLTKLRTKPTHIPTAEERELAEIGPRFRAHPVNHAVLVGPNPVTKRSRPTLTIPQSPAIHKPRPPAPRPPSPPRVIRANPIPDVAPFEPQLPRRAVLPADFELPGDEISRRKREEAEAERRRQSEEARKARRFVARALPDDEVPEPLPPVETKPLTYPEAFQLSTDARGEEHQRRLREQLEKEKREKENRTRFRARPFREVEPFVPAKSARPATEPEAVVLHSDLRAEERRAFEEAQKERERMAEELRKRQEMEMEEREKAEIRELRRRAVHRAEPIRSYAPVVVKPSNKPLTDAESPMIGEKRRRAAQAQNVSASN